MTDRDAFLAAIAAHPEDDLPRLVYADYCEEQGTDRELATAEFVRLTCGRTEPKRARARTRKCRAVGPHHGDRCAGGRIESPNAAFTRDCPACKGTGREPNPPGVRQYPKAAHEWLRANWRRLVPALAAWWDDPKAQLVDAMVEKVLVVPAGGSFVEALTSPITVGRPFFGKFAAWTKRGTLRCGVPFVLPGYWNDAEANVQRGDRVYTPVVRLSFARGFVTDATWRAPVLGEKIAPALADDQPLAVQTGPHALLFCGGMGTGPITAPPTGRYRSSRGQPPTAVPGFHSYRRPPWSARRP